MKLNLGCYKSYKKGYVHLDKEKFFPHIDVVHNLENFPYPFKNNTFEEVLMNCVLEHLNNPTKVLEEVYRICKPNARIRILVPYGDKWMKSIDHKRGFTDATFHTLNRYKEPKQYRYISNILRLKLIKIKYIPTQVGWIIPSVRLPFMKSNLRVFVSYFINNIIEDIYVELRVIK